VYRPHDRYQEFAVLSSSIESEPFNSVYYILRPRYSMGNMSFFILGVEIQEGFSLKRSINSVVNSITSPSSRFISTKDVKHYSYFCARWNGECYDVHDVHRLRGVWEDYLTLSISG
jgi:hypothetical protein